MKLFGEEIAVKAHIENVDGFSGHADQPMLLDWVDHFQRKPKKVFLVHGEADEMMPLADKLRERYDGMEVLTPRRFETVELRVPKDSVIRQPDPETLKKELEMQYELVLADMGGIRSIREEVAKELTPVEYEAMRQKLMQIQADIMDVKMLIGD